MQGLRGLFSSSKPILPTSRAGERSPAIGLNRLSLSGPTREGERSGTSAAEFGAVTSTNSMPWWSPSRQSHATTSNQASQGNRIRQPGGNVLPASEPYASPSAGPTTPASQQSANWAAAISLPSSGSSLGTEVAAISLPPSRSSTHEPGVPAAAALLALNSQSSLQALQAATIRPTTTTTTTTTTDGQQQSVNSGKASLAGYPNLAQHMASMPEASIFRSFATLNIRNLLYMQAELVHLEKDLHSFQLKDARARGTTAVRREYMTNWLPLSQSTSKEENAVVAEEEGEQQQQQQERNGSQWRTMEAIREKLRIYNEAVIQTMKVLSASEPSVHDLRDIQEYLRSTEMANGEGLTGQDHAVWGCVAKHFELEPADDLITLLPRPESDSLTQLVVNRVVRRLHSRKEGWFQWIWGRTGGNGDCSGTVVVNDKTIHRLTFVLTSGVASMLPVVSMVALQRVEAVQVRGLSLGLIAIFNFVLAVLLTWWTSVKRAEVFAVAAAFAAVNVVFITK